MADQPPVHQIARVMNRHAGEPLERGVRDVVIIARTTNTRVGMKARENRILNLAHG
jgi:hypothetical protein